MRILIAEDDTVSRLLLARSVEKLGHTCEIAVDGEQAWAMFGASEYELVISDWMMPSLDGLDLCRRIRAHTGGYTYFILLTALGGKENFVSGMEAGADDYLTKPLDRDALKARLMVAARIMTLHRQLEGKNRELADLNQRLFEEGRVDPLTRVGNRLRMMEELSALHDRVTRYGHRYCVALCDIDYFKKYNDGCGHQAGDEALRTVAQVLAQQMRKSDSVYRYGGEEFLILLPEQDEARGLIAMERMRSAVESTALPHPANEPTGVVTISAGLAHLHQHEGGTLEEVLKRADDALYRAKARGRNCVVCAGSTD